jgi:hypothetical protein
MNEITAIGNTARTLVAQIFLGPIPQSGIITLTETAAPGFYTGTVPTGVPAGNYTVLVTDTGVIVASGLLFWDGTAEALTPVNVMQVHGLNVKVPWTEDNTWLA